MDAEGFHEQTPCPECGSPETVTYYYNEGFEELECSACGYRSDTQSVSDLQRESGEVLEHRHSGVTLPIRRIEA
ncbi:MAG: YheV family putative metal-binding protein [Trueperaceae bacterium]|nr:YheV family putative metal-binding protein [Trueperaceae bacterium]